MLSERKKLSADVQSILDAQTETWGIKVSNVEIRTVELTENMVRAIAKQGEAERDRRAKVIHAEAEFQASQTLVNAAKILGSIPAAMQLRYLQTLTEIGAEQNSTVVSGNLFAFRGKKASMLKILFWDGNGLCPFTQRLDRGTFVWPTMAGYDGSITLTPAQLAMLIEGIDWRAPERVWKPALAG